MVHFWVRELMGWLLVLLGLFIFYVCFVIMIRDALIAEASMFSVVGIFVFRGGIHLLKVAVAARIAMQVQTDPPKPAAAKVEEKKASVPWDW